MSSLLSKASLIDANPPIYIYIYIHIYIDIYIYRDRETERDRQTEREREKEGERYIDIYVSNIYKLRVSLLLRK